MIGYNESVHNIMWGGSGIYLCIFIMSLILVISNIRKNRYVFGAIIAISVLGIIISYNPLFMGFFCSNMYSTTPAEVNGAYSRMEWVFYILPIIAIAMVLFYDEIKDSARKTSAVIVCILMFLAANNTGNGYLPNTAAINHYYKMTDTAVELCDYMLRDKKTNEMIPVLVIEKDNLQSYLDKMSLDEYSIAIDLLYMIEPYSGSFSVYKTKANAGLEADWPEEYRYVISVTDTTINSMIDRDRYKTVWNNPYITFMELNIPDEE